MAKAALFMGPMARKKRVNEKYCPNSYRVISYEAEKVDRSAILTSIKRDSNINMLGQSTKPHLINEHRLNRPNPTSVGFLRQDVRLLNEPLCHVRTRDVAPEQAEWWPSRANDTSATKPEHTLDTTFRGDYQYRGREKLGSGRHTSNPNKRAAHGSVPVNFLREPDGEQRFWKEGISYEHQYDCRTDPQYPIRAKRHGAFVWDRFPKSEVNRMLDHYGMQAKPGSASLRKTPPVSDSVSPEKTNTDSQLPLSAPAHNALWGEDVLVQAPSPEKKPLSHTLVLPPIGY